MQADQRKACEVLQARLREVFPESVFSGAITGADGLQNEELDEERALFGALHGRSWPEIPASFIAWNPDGVVLLTEEAFAAFLPAWLNCALTHDEVREMLAYVFSPLVHQSMERNDHRIGLLTAPQRLVLLAFLAYCVDFEPSKYVKEHAQAALAHAAHVLDCMDRGQAEVFPGNS